MKTIVCDCGSDQVNYIGIDDVEGHSVIELFKCEECGTYIEIRTVVDINDESDIDPIERIDYDPRPWGER